ncbi:hypothetical protein [Arcticibacter tournemirensis]|uniref:Uncharacterized protein n=1 Tax=Arcticibacter tournemirensis TaxID=699437 RepID=A0A4Q0M4C1_9SPHI|nr:hypothetical protein [Arcticibacter tournemirensis]RXF67735.1 hypothetical protein EKH83_18070 [Arcticibacter tournemirensis]
MIDLNQLIDERNQALWDTLNAHFQIDFQPSANNEYRVYSINDSATFYVPENDHCADSFTHELLHVYLRYKKVFIGAAFINTVNSSKILKNLLNDRLTEHVGNCLDHIKMIDHYDQMGFPREKFITDYDQHKCTPSDLADLKRYYKQNGSYNTEAVNLYIGKFVAMCADFNESFDYEPCFAALDKLDPQLFTVLDQLVSDWEDLDIESDDILTSSYYPLLNTFYEGMKRWMTGKKLHAY